MVQVLPSADALTDLACAGCGVPFLSARIRPSPALPTISIEYSSVTVAVSSPFNGVGSEKCNT